MYLSDQASYAFFTARATLRTSFSSVSLQEQEQDLNRDARLCIAPQPPLAPSRGRSRSRSAERFQTRVAAVIAAHRINLAQRRTRAIHKHLLQILNEYVDRLHSAPTVDRGTCSKASGQRKVQRNFPASKFEVLLGLREFVRDNHDWREQLGLVSENWESSNKRHNLCPFEWTWERGQRR